jgi:hypothetical protein
MEEDLKWLIWLTEAEYDGRSFNGPNLVKTLKGLTMAQVTSDETYEGYTVWALVLHLIYWKYVLAKALGAEGLGEFPYEGKDWPAVPEDRSESAWQRTLELQDEIHAAYIGALKAFPADRLDEEMDWGCAYGQAVAWMASHDTYHTAMIRNMGLSGLEIA